MFTKLRTLRTIDESGALLIVPLQDADTAERVAHAAIEGGFRALEITLSIPGAVDLVHRLAAQYASEGVAVGQGRCSTATPRTSASAPARHSWSARSSTVR
jgi:2-dehydro-3-deoxyphosphogluconate aldolase/(4S)-4-hydroxy-2-oxoglutarate aldolase